MENELTEEQKISQTHAAFKEFADQFGENDVIKDIFLDILLEAIYGQTETTDNLPLSSEAGQKQPENTQQIRPGTMPCYEIE